jgi:DNA-binding transcriptional LysR family regulator
VDKRSYRWLTEAGRYFVEQVAVGIDHLDHAVKTAGLRARGEHGHLRISAYALISNGFLADLLNQYRTRHPSVEIDIAEYRAGDAVNFAACRNVPKAQELATWN